MSKTNVDVLVGAALAWPQLGQAFSYYWDAGWRSPLREGHFPVTADTVNRTGEMLWRENWSTTMDWDGSPHPEPPRYTFEALDGEPSALVVIRALDYYWAQTESDPDIWLSSEAFAFCVHLQAAANTHLPGYEAVPWGIEDEDRDIFLRFSANT